MKNLRKQIREVEEQHAEESLNTHLQKHDQEKFVRSLLLLGGIRAADRITRSISSQLMTALITFQEEKMHEQLGFAKFAEFLDNSEYSPMSKNDYYRRKEIFDAEGAEKYDLFNEAKISMATRKLIAKTAGADIVIEGDEIVIGDERTDISNLPRVKDLVNNLVIANKEIRIGKEKQEEKISGLRKQLETGAAEYQELQRAMDAASEGTPYERALTKAVGALINLAITANNSPIVEKDARGRADVQTLWKQMQNVRTALLQDDFVFTDDVIEVSTERKPISALAKKALADADDFGDEDEQ